MWLTRCLNCRRISSQALCDACWQQVQVLSNNCSYCALPLEDKGQNCPSCQDHLLPWHHMAYGSYQGMLQNLLYQIKYHHRFQLAVSMGCYLGSWFLKQKNRPEVDFILPIPLHIKRFEERGFNQAECLGRGVSKILKVPCYDILKRTIATPPLHSFSPEERRQQLDNVFLLADTDRARLKNRHILLIDDIMTTGATLSQAGNYLKRLGLDVTGSLSVTRV